MRTWRQKANDAAMFRCGLRNDLIKEAERLEERAFQLRLIAGDLSKDVELPAFARTT